MVKNNEWAIPKNIQKPIETIYELKGDEHKVPSFEEFMKTYENDGSLNYDDLSGGSVGEVKGYGPCEYSGCPHSSRFFIRVRFENGWSICPHKGTGYWTTTHFENVQEVRDLLRNFEKGEAKIVDRQDREWPEDVIAKKREVMIKLQDYVDAHERGERVYEPYWIVVKEEKTCIQS